MQEHQAALIRQDENDVCFLRIARSDALNALNRSLLTALSKEFKTISEDSKVRALVITGEGEKAFCAGADLKERRDMTLEQTRDFVRTIGQVFRQLELLEIPTIAAMNGVAFGGGLELALACDFRIAIQSAKMGLTECALGIIPGAGGTQRLPRLIGPTLAKEMILTARILDADSAMQMGLLSAVAVTQEDLMVEVGKLIERLKKCAPLSIRAAKKAIDGGSGLNMPQALELEWMAYQTILESEDRVEGLKAFAEKRTPQFAGR